MTSTKSSQSLASYLDPKNNRFYLKISLWAENPAVLAKNVSPFLTIDDAGPLARVIKAKCMTNNGEEIKQMFLLVQKDAYNFVGDPLRPVTNRDIDRLWQEAFMFYAGKKDASFLSLFSDPSHNGKGPIRFDSLFFCKHRQVYFHPLCPACGSRLDLCDDDELLKGVGLLPYSISTRRYLFCPACAQAGQAPPFYADSLSSEEPVLLKDRMELIKDFHAIAENDAYADLFPCNNCPEKPRCYGSENLAFLRITPFSFYPFWMLVFDGMTVNAIDFISLLSGASFDEMEGRLADMQESGRRHCMQALRKDRTGHTPFLCHEEDRFFLEVLYLKLCFVGELVREWSPMIRQPGIPGMCPVLDRIWIKLADQGGLLPYLWNFKAKSLDVVGFGTSSPLNSKTSLYQTAHDLGLVWLYIFLVNKRQNMQQVSAVIEKTAATLHPDMEIEGKGIFTTPDPAFYPENIFWNPERGSGKVLNETWIDLWKKTLAFGWSLLYAGFHQDFTRSEDALERDLALLRKEVRYHLFQPGTAAVHPAPDVDEDRVVMDILSRIRHKWQIREQAGAFAQDSDQTRFKPPSSKEAPGPEALPTEDEDEAHTVILSSRDLKNPPGEPGPQEDALDETVVVSRLGATTDLRISSGPDEPDKGLGETKIISAPGPERETGEDFPQTTVIHKSALEKTGNGGNDKGTPEDDDVPKTVILGAKKKEPKE